MLQNKIIKQFSLWFKKGKLELTYIRDWFVKESFTVVVKLCHFLTFF